MTPATQLLYNMLTENQIITMEAWAQALDAASKGSIGIGSCRALTVRARPGAVREINRNGMSIVNLTRDDKVAGTGKGSRTFSLKRVDDAEDPLFMEQLRHFGEAGQGFHDRVAAEASSAQRRGLLSASSALLLAGVSAGGLTDDGVPA